jgi:hypothetical protein
MSVQKKMCVLFGKIVCSVAIFCCYQAVLVNHAYGQHIASRQQRITLSNDHLKLEWVNTSEGWKMTKFVAMAGSAFLPFGDASGMYHIIYSPTKPADTALHIMDNGKQVLFPEKRFRYVYPDFQRAMSAVPMNRAGKKISFFPSYAQQQGDSVIFKQSLKEGDMEAIWKLDKRFPGDVSIRLRFTASADGYYSLASPTLSTIKKDRLKWASVPGYFQGNSIQKSFPLAYAYAQGLPAYPVLCRESTITTMASIMSDKNGLSMAVIPEPGQDRNPYLKDAVTHFSLWKIALSHMNPNGLLTPTAYHPVLGEDGSFLRKGEKTAFNIRVTLKQENWYSVYKHAIYDIYHLRHFFEIEENKQSLTDRLLKQYRYVMNDKTALWHKGVYQGDTIMAQSYLGGVAGAEGDAMKNSDIGAVWMLARLTNDSLLYKKRLPFIRNFKTLQQNTTGFFKGAVAGQYFLAKKKIFTEEWGNHFEPIGITYYTMMDLGNILLFEKNNPELKLLLRNGADRLLKWQHADGSWEVAYDRETHQPIYTDLKDLRPTFYGLLVAYKLLKDQKYLAGAIKGAQWLMKNATAKGSFLGVCGDARFVNDFATIQCADAFLDLYQVTGDKQLLKAAVATAQIYTTSIYTHPIPGTELKTLNQKTVQDWQLSQVGLNFEHGGTMGSAVNNGPILLASHAGFFLRLYRLTKDSLFLDLARIGALGKDAFVDKNSGVASYYWRRFDQGPGSFPHHAWWQIGWIYDYLVAEAETRSGGRIGFPRGFMTPKVGPQKPVGFEPGIIDGNKVNLIIRRDLVHIDNPNIDYLTALSLDGQCLYVVLLNDQGKKNSFNVTVDTRSLTWKLPTDKQTVELGAFGYKVLKIIGNK